MVTGRTKGVTDRAAGNVVFVAAQRDDFDGNPTEEYLLLRATPNGLLRVADPNAGGAAPAPATDAVVTVLFTAQRLDDSPTEVNSEDDGDFAAIFDASTFRRWSLELTIDATLTPTDIEFFAEFTNDAGTSWAHYAQDLFASLVYSDADVATEKHQIFGGEVVGQGFRLRVVATGTDGTNFFDFSATIRFYK